jgi:putative transposase
VQPLIDHLIERGLDLGGLAAVHRRRRWGLEQSRPPHHKARNVIEWLPKPLHETGRKALRQVWELNDADRALRHQAARRKLRWRKRRYGGNMYLIPINGL